MLDPFWSFSTQEEYEQVRLRVDKEIQKRGGAIPYDHGFVYAIHAVGSNYFKFGKTNNPDRRILEIAPKMPFDCRFVAVWPSMFMGHAERTVHKLLESKRSNGEWFLLDENWQERIFYIEQDLWEQVIYFSYCREFFAIAAGFQQEYLDCPWGMKHWFKLWEYWEERDIYLDEDWYYAYMLQEYRQHNRHKKGSPIAQDFQQKFRKNFLGV